MENQKTLEGTGTLSLQAIKGLSTGGIIRIKGSLEKRSAMILLDNGSSRFTMDTVVAEGPKVRIVHNRPLMVVVEMAIK